MDQFFSYEDNYKLEDNFFPLKEQKWKLFDDLHMSMNFTKSQL